MTEVEVMIERGVKEAEALPEVSETKIEIDRQETVKEVISQTEQEEPEGMLKFARDGLVANERKKEAEKTVAKLKEQEGEEEELKEQKLVTLAEIVDSEGKIIKISEPQKEELVEKESEHEKYLGPEKRYKLMEKVGEGGFAEVYKAEETTTGILKAIKIFHKDKAKNIPTAKLEAKIREINARAGNEVVKVENICDDADGKYLIMPYCEKTVADFIKEDKKDSEKIKLFLDILEQVQKIHEKGLVHRDLKPSNILIDEGKPRLTDLDLVQILEQENGVEISKYLASTTMESNIMSIAYASPEQKKGEKTDSRSDIYSLGIMLYEMLTGDLPDLDWRGQLEEKQHSSEIIDVIAKATKKKKEERYQNVKEFLEAAGKIPIEKMMEREKVEEKNDIEEKLEETHQMKKDAEEIKSEEKISKKYEEQFNKYICKYRGFERFYLDDLEPNELIIKTAQIVKELNQILIKYSSDKNLALKKMEVSMHNIKGTYTKIASNFETLESLIKSNYLPSKCTFIFESDKNLINIEYYEIKDGKEIMEIREKNKDYRFNEGKYLKINLSLKQYPEKNIELYTELYKYFENLNCWKTRRSRGYFRKLANQGYTYENAKKLFLEGTYEQFGMKEEEDIVINETRNYDHLRTNGIGEIGKALYAENGKYLGKIKSFLCDGGIVIGALVKKGLFSKKKIILYDRGETKKYDKEDVVKKYKKGSFSIYNYRAFGAALSDDYVSELHMNSDGRVVVHTRRTYFDGVTG